jgi:hypothetical protein
MFNQGFGAGLFVTWDNVFDISAFGGGTPSGIIRSYLVSFLQKIKDTTY